MITENEIVPTDHVTEGQKVAYNPNRKARRTNKHRGMRSGTGYSNKQWKLLKKRRRITRAMQLINRQ